MKCAACGLEAEGLPDAELVIPVERPDKSTSLLRVCIEGYARRDSGMVTDEVCRPCLAVAAARIAGLLASTDPVIRVRRGY